MPIEQVSGGDQYELWQIGHQPFLNPSFPATGSLTNAGVRLSRT